MHKVTVQVPMSNDLRKKAEIASIDMGFSSLQETIRVLLTKLSKRELMIKIENQTEETFSLSLKAEQRYKKAAEDIKSGQSLYKPKNKKEFFEMLNS